MSDKIVLKDGEIVNYNPNEGEASVAYPGGAVMRERAPRLGEWNWVGVLGREATARQAAELRGETP